MGKPDVSIIRCGSIFFFTTSLPPDSSISTLHQSIGFSSEVSTDIIMGGGREYFALQITSFLLRRRDHDSAIRHALEYTWSELHRRGVVDSADMPDPIEGDPRLMLLRLTDLIDNKGDVCVRDGVICAGDREIGRVPTRIYS